MNCIIVCFFLLPEHAGVVPFLRDNVILRHGSCVEEHAYHLYAGVTVQGACVGVPVCDFEGELGMHPCAFVKAPGSRSKSTRGE